MYYAFPFTHTRSVIIMINHTLYIVGHPSMLCKAAMDVSCRL